MRTLVINAGSSSVRADVLETVSGERLATARAERLGTDEATLRFDAESAQPLSASDTAAALRRLLPELIDRGGTPAAVAHRVVHGGERFTAPVRVDAEVEQALEGLADLAPLHNPVNLAGIRVARELLPELPHVAVFDTAFHATLPPRARHYALPRHLTRKLGIRRYGFHGTSHGWVARRAAEHLGRDLERLRLITCHLGNGASVAAIEFGRCIETSMGMTPLEGLVMGTRSGDLDPGVLVELVRREGLDAEGLDTLLNQHSGLAGLSGTGGDLRDIETRAADGDEDCRLAIQVFCHRIRKYIGAYAAVLGGVDAIVFTGGIGENSAGVRHRVGQRLGFLGALIDEDRNRDARVEPARPVAEISRPHATARLLVVASDEALAIAREAADLVGGRHAVADVDSIPVAISARHVHLTSEAVERLFGTGHRLTSAQALSQPGQFACEERVTLIGPKRSLPGVRVVGPVRSRVQVEISRSDEFHLGVDAPVRCSGDLDGTPGITLEGPAGRMEIDEGVICAQRHIHITTEDAARMGVGHKDVVEVAIDSDGRDLIFGDVVVRVSDSFRTEMHLDTDEGNAAEIERGDEGVLRRTDRAAHLRRRR